MYDIESQIIKLMNQIDINNLKPNLLNNRIFSTIVNLVLEANQNPLYNDFNFESDSWYKLTTHFQKISSVAESCMENHYSNIGVVHFPYLQNYKDMIKYEIQCLKSINKSKFKSILFIGSGPLPLSSLLYKKTLGVKITNIDYDINSIRIAKSLFPNMNYIHTNILNLSISNLEEYDLIVLGAMVGNNSSSKKEILKHIFKCLNSNQVVLARDAPRFSSLIYTPLPDIIESNFVTTSFENIKPKTVINSCRIYYQKLNIMTETIINQKNTLLQESEQRLIENLQLLKEYNTINDKIQAIKFFSLTQPKLSLLIDKQKEPVESPELVRLTEQLQKIGDSMVFGPVDWVEYKMQTKKFITLQQFVDHCNGGDSICPLRFKFLESKWINKYNKTIMECVDLNSTLSNFISSDEFLDLVLDPYFNKSWWDNEGMQDENGNIAKWGIVYKY